MSISERDQLQRAALDLRRRVEKAFGPETAAEGFQGAGPSTGQCAATALVANAVLGGRFVSANVHEQSHWFNRVWASERWWDVDLTGDQFGLPSIQIKEAEQLYTDSRVRMPEDVTSETLRRAVRLAGRAGMTGVAERLQTWLDGKAQIAVDDLTR